MEKIKIEETKEKTRKRWGDGRPSAIVAAKCDGKDKNWRDKRENMKKMRWWATRCNSGCKVWQEWRLSLPSCKNPQPAPEQQHHDHIGDDNSDADYDDMIMTTMMMMNFLHWRFHRRISNQHYDAPSKLNVSDQCEPNKLHDEGSIGDVAFLPFPLDSCALTPTVPSLVQLVPLIVLSW